MAFTTYLLETDTRNRPYTLSSCPHEVLCRPKDKQYMMYDRRVVRGHPLELHRQETRRRNMTKKPLKGRFRPKTPEPVEGRVHAFVQTELYLEELSDRIEIVSVECQTDMFLDRPATPLFIPAKTGHDVATQIEEGELFDFDLEVQPILEVLVGKTIEQALLEVMEEEELANLRAQQKAFNESRDAELVEVQRLEEREQRLHVERDMRIMEQKEMLEKEKEFAEKLAAREFAQQYVSNLVSSVHSDLWERGYYHDPLQRELETGLLPQVMEDVNITLNKRDVARMVNDMLIQDVTNQRFEAFQIQE